MAYRKNMHLYRLHWQHVDGGPIGLMNAWSRKSSAETALREYSTNQPHRKFWIETSVPSIIFPASTRDHGRIHVMKD